MRGYLGDEDDKGSKRAEKLKIVKRGTKDSLAKDKASVKYNYQDFLSAADNLTDQCKHLVEALSQATQECIICANPIYQRSALWNCRQCCQPFHLGCIKRWINKLNTGKEAPVGEEADEEEEKVQEDPRARGAFADEDEYEESLLEAESRKDQKVAQAFYSWTCPNCNYSYAES